MGRANLIAIQNQLFGSDYEETQVGRDIAVLIGEVARLRQIVEGTADGLRLYQESFQGAPVPANIFLDGLIDHIATAS
jgi:hypothetical protein